MRSKPVALLLADLAVFRVKELSPQVKTNLPDGSPVKIFKSKQDWAAWLEKNHRKSTGLWLRLAKKASRLRSVSY